MLTSIALISMLAGAPAQDCSSTKAVEQVEAKKTIVETALANENFTTLVAALKAGELVEPLSGKGPFTVFAPTNDAFAALPKGTLEELLKKENKATLQSILTYHVAAANLPAKKVVKSPFLTTLNGQRAQFRVSDEGVFINGAQIVTTDIHCSNGVIHVIDAVLLPNTKDVVDTAIEAGSFRTLTAAIKAAGLVEALKAKGPVTVFAPNEKAFAALPEGTIANLLKPENKHQLQEILKLHVISGRVYSDSAAKGAKVKSLQGQTIVTKSEHGKVFVNGAQVVQADIDASNGVIHVIDKVLLPQ